MNLVKIALQALSTAQERCYRNGEYLQTSLIYDQVADVIVKSKLMTSKHGLSILHSVFHLMTETFGRVQDGNFGRQRIKVPQILSSVIKLVQASSSSTQSFCFEVLGALLSNQSNLKFLGGISPLTEITNHYKASIIDESDKFHTVLWKILTLASSSALNTKDARALLRLRFQSKKTSPSLETLPMAANTNVTLATGTSGSASIHLDDQLRVPLPTIKSLIESSVSCLTTVPSISFEASKVSYLFV